MKKRILPESNYSAIYVDGETIRIPIDIEREITELEWPEFYDVAFNNKCYGNCGGYCYTSALHTGVNFSNVVEKIHSFFGSMTENQRPFQIAGGGAGEPTLHPDFFEICKTFRDYGITPNITTNGMHLTDKTMDAIVSYCGGAAVSLHPHLEKHWRKAIDLLSEAKVRLNVHYIVSDEDSLLTLNRLYHELRGTVKCFVLLPRVPVGFASGLEPVNYHALGLWMENVYKNEDIAFGSQAYEFLKGHPEYGTSLYPPEIMSKYLVMDDAMQLYNNSFEMRPWNRKQTK